MSRVLLSTAQVHEAARETVTIAGEELYISKSYLWRNDMPTYPDPVLPLRTGPANLALTVRRSQPDRATPHTSLAASVLPRVVALHVIREDPTPHALAPVSPDSPDSPHFAWPAPPPPPPPPSTPPVPELSEPEMDGFATSASGREYVAAAVTDGGNALALSAWAGPRWGSLRNGLDDTVEYVAIVEFEGGVFLRSGTQRMQIVH